MTLQSNNNRRWSILLFVILVTIPALPIVSRVVYVEYYFDDSVNQMTSEEQSYTSHNAQPFIDNPLISSNVDSTYSNVAISISLSFAMILSVIILVYYLKTGKAGFLKNWHR